MALPLVSDSGFAANGQAKTGTPEQIEFFEKRIRPLLVNHCYKCHSQDADNVRGELYLDTREGVQLAAVQAALQMLRDRIR